jgi:hypothetical protein
LGVFVGKLHPRREKKMKPQLRFKALAGILQRLLVFQYVCGERRALPRAKNSQTFGTPPIFGAFRKKPQTCVSNCSANFDI